MAASKSRIALAQLSGVGGASAVADISAAYRASLYLKHVNGTGTISQGALVTIQLRTSGGSEWYDYLPIPFGTTASQQELKGGIEIPDDAGAVRVNYTPPSGSTGHTLDIEVGTVTGY